MPRAKKPKKAKVVEPVEETPVVEPEVIESVEEVIEPVEERKEWAVLDANGHEVRTYSIEMHGENAKELAKEYSGKIGGSIQ